MTLAHKHSTSDISIIIDIHLKHFPMDKNQYSHRQGSIFSLTRINILINKNQHSQVARSISQDKNQDSQYCIPKYTNLKRNYLIYYN